MRHSPAFVARWALFAGERWSLLHVSGTSLGSLFLLLGAGLGSALFLRDALPALLDLAWGRGPGRAPVRWRETAEVLGALAGRHARALGIDCPDVRLVHAPGPVLLCAGALRPVLVASPAVASVLRGEELDAAVAHEVAHARHRDPAWGYGLMALRAAMFFNPAVQWLARALVDDIERRADQEAVRLVGRADTLARVIRLLFEAGHPPPAESEASFEVLFWRIRRAGAERRCRRLAEPAVAGPMAHGATRMILAAAAVLALTFFVV